MNVFLFSALVVMYTNGFNLECSVKAMYWPSYGSIKRCLAINLTVTSSNQIVSTVNGETSENFQDKDIKGIYVIDSNISFFPKGLNEFFPHLEGIWINGSYLKSIEKSDLEAFVSLNYIVIQSNELEQLDSDLFESNPDMRYVSFKNNKLTAIGEDLFENLPKLSYVNFLENTCIDKFVTNELDVPEMIAELRTKCPSTPLMKSR